LFVYETTIGTGYSVTPKPHTKLWGWGTTVDLPPNAGDWASTSAPYFPKSTIVSTPEPGDIVAWSHDYSDATGHVAIVSYPAPSTPQSQGLAPGDDVSVDITMRRQVIGANELLVDEDTTHFWHYYDEGNSAETSKIVFRRLSK
jgi:hypothetical protein